MAESVLHIKSVFIVRENTFQAVHMSMPSKFQRTFVLIAPLMKFAGRAVLDLLEETTANTRIILISVHLKDMEMLRSQLHYKKRTRFICCSCEIFSLTAIKMTVLYLARKLDRLDGIIHLVPLLDLEDTEKRIRPLLCANAASVENFRSGLMDFFGPQIKYVKLEHTIRDCPYSISEQVVEIAKSF